MTLTFAAEPVVAAECEVRDHVLVMDDAIRGTLGGVFAPGNRARGGGNLSFRKRYLKKCTKGGDYRILAHRNCLRIKSCMYNTTRTLGAKERQRNETERNANKQNETKQK